MKQLTDTPVEWAALTDVPVVSGFRRSLPVRFPGDPRFYDLFRIRRLHATILVPKTITAFSAAKPIPILELARRRITDGAFAFATGRGFDLYRIEHRRLAACSAASRVPPGAHAITADPEHSRRLSAAALRRVYRLARLLPAVVAILAAAAGVLPTVVHPPKSAAEPREAVQAPPREVTAPEAGAMLRYAGIVLARLHAIDAGLALRHLSVSHGTMRLVAASNRTLREALPLTAAVARHGGMTRLTPRDGGVLLELEVSQVDPGDLPPRETLRTRELPGFTPSESGDPDAPGESATLTEHSRTDRECRETWRLSASGVAELHALLLEQQTLLSLSLEVIDDHHWRGEVVRGAPCAALPMTVSNPDAEAPPATGAAATAATAPAASIAADHGEELRGFLLDGSGRLFAWRRTRGYLDLEEIR